MFSLCNGEHTSLAAVAVGRSVGQSVSSSVRQSVGTVAHALPAPQTRATRCAYSTVVRAGMKPNLGAARQPSWRAAHRRFGTQSFRLAGGPVRGGARRGDLSKLCAHALATKTERQSFVRPFVRDSASERRTVTVTGEKGPNEGPSGLLQDVHDSTELVQQFDKLRFRFARNKLGI